MLQLQGRRDRALGMAGATEKRRERVAAELQQAAIPIAKRANERAEQRADRTRHQLSALAAKRTQARREPGESTQIRSEQRPLNMVNSSGASGGQRTAAYFDILWDVRDDML
jgi:hypothetical protein